MAQCRGVTLHAPLAWRWTCKTISIGSQSRRTCSGKRRPWMIACAMFKVGRTRRVIQTWAQVCVSHLVAYVANGPTAAAQFLQTIDATKHPPHR
eukprot:11000404-Lingulodinium_polyedra.AAC.1